MNLEVYLLDTLFSIRPEPCSAYENKGLVLTDFALRSAGIDSSLLPKGVAECPRGKDEGDFYKNTLRQEMLETVDDKKQKIFGISACTQSYNFLEDLAGIIREDFSDAIIVGGGPGFTTAGETKVKFYNGLLDAYVAGHSEPLVELCTGLLSGELAFDNGQFSGNMPNGLYYRLNGNVAGIGHGRFPKIDVGCVDDSIYTLKTVGDKEYAHFYVVLSDACPNNCGYCSSPKAGKPAGVFMDYVGEMAKNPFFIGRTVIVDIEDNNPLMKNNRALTEQFLSASARLSGDMYYSNFLDPSLLTGEDYEYILSRVLNSNSRRAFFIGRDFISEKAAKKYGRNWYGIPRDQKRLDAELEGIVKFLKATDAHKKHTGVTLSYILSPDDDLQLYGRLASELLYLSVLDMVLDNSRISFSPGILTPFPGTKIREDNRARINDEIPWSSYDTWTNVWKDAPLLGRLEDAFYTPLKIKQRSWLKKHVNDIACVAFPYVSAEEENSWRNKAILGKLYKWAYGLMFELYENKADNISGIEKRVLEELEPMRA